MECTAEAESIANDHVDYKINVKGPGFALRYTIGAVPPG